MTQLPNDTFMLLSFVNTKLRDFYRTLDELCDDMGINKDALVKKLREAGFEYDSEQNKFW